MTRRTGLEQAEHIAAAKTRLAVGETQRAVATALGVVRSTLQGGGRDIARGEPRGGLAAFLRAPDRVARWHRLVLAMHFSMTLRAAGVTRLMIERLEMSGLSAFVGVSDGAQHALDVALDTAVAGVAAAQRTALAGGDSGVLAILHDLNLACAYAGRLLLLAGGRVVTQDRPAAVVDGGHFGPRRRCSPARSCASRRRQRGCCRARRAQAALRDDRPRR